MKISEKMLAAYLEGNTNKEETLQVLDALANDPELREIVEIAMSVDEEFKDMSAFELEEEIKQKMADSLGLYYSIMLRPEHIIIEGEVEPRLKEEKNISQSMPSSEGRGL